MHVVHHCILWIISEALASVVYTVAIPLLKLYANQIYIYTFGAMQVKCSSGDYMNVPYRSDAVLVNLGALMQNWTSDVYVATVRQPCM